MDEKPGTERMEARIDYLTAQLVKKESELETLRSRLEKVRERESELEDERKAMMFMLEDINESASLLKKARKEWEATFDSIPDPVFIHDEEMRITIANKAYCREAGTTFDGIEGRPYYEVFPKMPGPHDMCAKTRELKEGTEEETALPSSQKIFRVKDYPVMYEERGAAYLHVMEDITEIRNAYERIKDEKDVTTHLLMIASATARTTDIDRLMEQAIECVSKIIRCDICLSYLWDKGGKVLRPAHAKGLNHEMTSLFRNQTLDARDRFIEDAFEGKKTEISLDTGLYGWIEGIRTMAMIPLFGKVDCLGLVIAVYKTPKEFGEREKKILEGFSSQVSLALEQARLYRDSVDKSMLLSRQIETVQVMHEIDRSILSTLDIEEVLNTTARMVTRLIPCDRVTVALIDKKRGGFIYGAGFGISSLAKGSFVPFVETSATEVIETGSPQYTADLTKEEELKPLEGLLLKEGFLSHVRVPLLLKGEVSGVLSIGAKRPSAFSVGDLETLEKLADQIGVAIENARLVKDLGELFLGVVKSLSSAIDAKSPWTAGHSDRVTKYAVGIGKTMGMPEEELKGLNLAGHLHDVGKIGTYEAVLDKPGKLNDEEMNIMRQHPVKGAEILSHISQLEEILPAIRHHHESYDGTGYPDGLKAEAIPLFSRILAVADTIDAMSADRPYRKGRTMDAIVAELKRCSGTQFDPKVVEAFLRTPGKTG
ncbi:MAG: GAF domain-containing protein [Deltaproteobacteria bacterium]|nr:GAF domain-containing protein [Deltaproteobacteria bacterium]